MSSSKASSSTRRSRRTVAVLAVTGSMLACAHQTDAKTRQVFEQSTGGGKSGTAGSGGGPGQNDDPSSGDSLSSKVGWERVDELVRESADILEASPGTDTVARLAQAWCDVEPEPKQTDHGEVRVCFPQPPVTIDGHAFSLELGAVGVIGLVASDLSDRDSRALTDLALARIRPVCSDSFEKAASERGARHEVHTCATDGGSLLAIGRLPVSQGVWQVSIAVVGAT